MVEIDQCREGDEPVDTEQAAAFRIALERLVGPREAPEPQFRERYTALLQQWPAAAMAHGDLRRLLGKLPDSARSVD
jgi:hypothetical protein